MEPKHFRPKRSQKIPKEHQAQGSWANEFLGIIWILNLGFLVARPSKNPWKPQPQEPQEPQLSGFNPLGPYLGDTTCEVPITFPSSSTSHARRRNRSEVLLFQRGVWAELQKSDTEDEGDDQQKPRRHISRFSRRNTGSSNENPNCRVDGSWRQAAWAWRRPIDKPQSSLWSKSSTLVAIRWATCSWHCWDIPRPKGRRYMQEINKDCWLMRHYATSNLCCT